MSEEIKLAPEEVERVKSIISQAYQDMEGVAHAIGAHSADVAEAYTGAGTGQAMETYDQLARTGRALADALDGLSQDLGVTADTGRETDSDAEAALSRVHVTPDATVRGGLE
ncbi:WXG100 family type VII secretion target [Streptomyces mayteni]